MIYRTECPDCGGPTRLAFNTTEAYVACRRCGHVSPNVAPEACPATGRTAAWCEDQTHATCAGAAGLTPASWPDGRRRVRRLRDSGDHVPASGGFSKRACLAVAPGAVGDCVRPKGHDDLHQGAHGWAW